SICHPRAGPFQQAHPKTADHPSPDLTDYGIYRAASACSAAVAPLNFLAWGALHLRSTAAPSPEGPLGTPFHHGRKPARNLPRYLSECLRIMTDPDVPDEQQIVNRKSLHYTFRWVAEEDRHAHVLEMYMVKSGLITERELQQEMLRERRTGYVFPYHQMVEGFIYLALQEKATHLYYRALARDIDEPLLKAILGKMGADEASHGAF